MRENLEPSLKLLFGDEGGYSNAKTDSGNFLNGELVGTKYGITGKTLAASRGVKHVTAAQVKSMSIDEAEKIYRKSYWGQSGGDVLPSGLDYAVFNSAVMSGPSRAVKILQEIVGSSVDGVIGPKTLDAIKRYRNGNTVSLIRAYCDEYMKFLQGLGGKQGFAVNGRGWTIRITGKDPQGKWKSTPGVVGNAIAMAQSDPVKPTAVDAPAGAAKATQEQTSVDTILKKPEAALPIIGAAGSFIASVFGAVTDNPILSATVGIAFLALVGTGVWYFVQRVRSDG